MCVPGILNHVVRYWWLTHIYHTSTSGPSLPIVSLFLSGMLTCNITARLATKEVLTFLKENCEKIANYEMPEARSSNCSDDWKIYDRWEEICTSQILEAMKKNTRTSTLHAKYCASIVSMAMGTLLLLEITYTILTIYITDYHCNAFNYPVDCSDDQ